MFAKIDRSFNYKSNKDCCYIIRDMCDSTMFVVSKAFIIFIKLFKNSFVNIFMPMKWHVRIYIAVLCDHNILITLSMLRAKCKANIANS